MLGRLTTPVPFGLWMMNVFCQRVLGINKECRFMVHFTSTVITAQSIRLGRNVWKVFAISGGCCFQGLNGIEIGDDTMFAPGVRIISANHTKGDLSGHDAAEPIRIGKRCWIGANAVILPGVQLGDDVIVGAGAVVNRNVLAGVTIAGVPAHVVAEVSKSPAVRV